MKTVVFSSRRQDLTDEQRKALEAFIGPFTVQERAQGWQATEDGNADRLDNRMRWRDLADAGDYIVGDFPHAALEALNTFSNFNKPVLVRVYAIGGGFKRDTEFVRWAFLNDGEG